MTAQVKSSGNHETQILITIKHGNSMLDFEANLQESLNQAVMLGTERQLEFMDTDGSQVEEDLLQIFMTAFPATPHNENNALPQCI